MHTCTYVSAGGTWSIPLIFFVEVVWFDGGTVLASVPVLALLALGIWSLFPRAPRIGSHLPGVSVA